MCRPTTPARPRHRRAYLAPAVRDKDAAPLAAVERLHDPQAVALLAGPDERLEQGLRWQCQSPG